jgi:hypothetical protein
MILLDFRLMSRLFLVAATVLPMLIHSIVGCCWHHAHGATPLGGCEQFDTEVFHQAGKHKSCSHDHSPNGPSAGTADAKPVAKATGQANDPGCPADGPPPCDEGRCVEFWAESAKEKIGFAVWIVELATGRPSDFVPQQSMSSIRLLDLHASQAEAASPRAQTQVWIV